MRASMLDRRCHQRRRLSRRGSRASLETYAQKHVNRVCDSQLTIFSELRLIMTHDPETRLDPNVIERSTKLPVIQVDATKKTQSEGFESYKIGRKHLLVRSSLPPRILQKILSTTWTTGMLPEPLRIAHLLARSRFFAKNARFQANK